MYLEKGKYVSYFVFQGSYTSVGALFCLDGAKRLSRLVFLLQFLSVCRDVLVSLCDEAPSVI